MTAGKHSKRSARREFLIQAVSALGLAAVFAIERRALAQGERPPGIYRMQGSVRVNGKPARKGLVIRPGDTVEAGARSRAVFVIGADAYLLRAGSRVETSGSELFVEALRIVAGKLLSVLGPGERRIETPTAVIGIRGTGIYVESGRRRSYVCTCYGVADLAPRNMPEMRETVVTTHHEQPRYIYASYAMPIDKMMEKAPVINHTDAELILLESLVGRKPPFFDSGAPPYR